MYLCSNFGSILVCNGFVEPRGGIDFEDIELIVELVVDNVNSGQVEVNGCGSGNGQCS